MDDHMLIRAAQQGCPDAWAALFQRYQPRIHGLARTLGTDAAEDVCQETWVNLVKYLYRYEVRDDTPFWPWLAVIVRHIVARQARHNRIQVVYDVTMIDRESATEETAIGRVFARQLVGMLPDSRDREIVTLRHWHDLTFLEIGARVGIEKSTARDYYFRAINELRDVLRGLAPPKSHQHRVASLSPALQEEARRRYASGEMGVKNLAAVYGVSAVTMGQYVRGLKTITCARCGATDVRPARPNSFTCQPCFDALEAASERWCSRGCHAVPAGPPSASGPCAACLKRAYQARRVAYGRAV